MRPSTCLPLPQGDLPALLFCRATTEHKAPCSAAPLCHPAHTGDGRRAGRRRPRSSRQGWLRPTRRTASTRGGAPPGAAAEARRHPSPRLSTVQRRPRQPTPTAGATNSSCCCATAPARRGGNGQWPALRVAASSGVAAYRSTLLRPLVDIQLPKMRKWNQSIPQR
jgi:hypothetical protein